MRVDYRLGGLKISLHEQRIANTTDVYGILSLIRLTVRSPWSVNNANALPHEQRQYELHAESSCMVLWHSDASGSAAHTNAARITVKIIFLDMYNDETMFSEKCQIACLPCVRPSVYASGKQSIIRYSLALFQSLLFCRSLSRPVLSYKYRTERLQSTQNSSLPEASIYGLHRHRYSRYS